MDPLFQVHMLNEVGKGKANAIAEAFDELVRKLSKLCPQSCREVSICRTKLEEAAFFAKKSMANDPENCE